MKAALYSLIFFSCYANAFAQTIAYEGNIKPIIQMHCMPCHTKTSIGPMPFETYNQVKAYAKMIAYVTENKIMPPWKADGGFSQLKNCTSLDEASITAVKTWIANGMPQGKDTGESKQYQPKKELSINKADMVIRMTKAFTILGDYTERSQVFVLPVNNKKEELIDAIEFVPGNKRFVKSCTVSIDTGQTATRYDANDLNYGYNSSTGVGFIPYEYNWYQWTAEEGAAIYSWPYVKKMPTGSKLLLHITYTASKTIQKDSSYIKLRFVRDAQRLAIMHSQIFIDTTHITNGPFKIDVGDKKKFYTVTHISKPVEIHSIMPMGQFALSSWEIYAMDSASGRRINLLKIPYWDAHWKKKYLLKTPVQLSAGSKIFGVAYYNNTDGNINLPILPPKKIKYGEGQRDELFVVQFDVVYKDEETKNTTTQNADR